MKKVVLLTLVGISAMFATACQDSNEVQPKDEIWYTSKDGTIVEPCMEIKKDILGVFGANIVSNTYQDGKGVIVFDDDVKQIGGLAFKNSSNLTSISIPESVTKIARGSFYDCTNLTSITIPNSVTDIEEWAFNKCASLTNIFIRNGIGI